MTGGQAGRTTASVFTIVWITVWTLSTVVWCIAIVDGIRIGDGELVGGAAILCVMSALLAGSGVVVARLRRRLVPPDGPAPRPLPDEKSVAREPMERLAEAEVAMWDLMEQLIESADESPVAQRVVDDVELGAYEAAGLFRRLAARVEAIEAAVPHAPAARRAGLEDGVRSLLVHLDRGLEGYRELVAAAAHVVLAGSWDPVPAELVEARDHLVALLAAMRDLSGGP